MDHWDREALVQLQFASDETGQLYLQRGDGGMDPLELWQFSDSFTASIVRTCLNLGLHSAVMQLFGPSLAKELRAPAGDEGASGE